MFILALGAVSPGWVAAHHSRAYFGNDVVTVAGELREVRWRNPHVELEVQVAEPDGTSRIWRIEGNSVYNIRRVGVRPDQVQPGMQVSVSGRRSTREADSLLMTRLALPDGQSFVFEGREAPQDRVDAVVDTLAENKGLFRVWSMPSADRAAIQGQTEDQPFTEAALAARANWNPLDNFALRCEPEGMPRIMINPHPFEFVDRGNRILLRTELYDTERVIHMDVSEIPVDAPASRLGVSVGIWDTGSLVVRTARINWPWFDNAGTPQSPDVEMVERYTLSEDQSRLNFDITVIDDATFTRPAHLHGYWLALGESILRYDCQPVER